MEYALVENGLVVNTNIPEVETLPDGSQVSGFDKLPPEDLKKLGWLPIQEVSAPAHDSNTQIVIDDGLKVVGDKVVRQWRVDVIPPSPPTIEDKFDSLVGLLVTKGTITQGQANALKASVPPSAKP